MTDRDKKISERLWSDYMLLRKMGYNVIGVFLQGSQNYELDYEGSDIDTKAIVLPSFKDIVLNHKPASTTHVLPSNEHVDIKDIRLMIECWKKQNINFLEVLFTKYYVLNPQYMSLFRPLMDNAEKIAHFNNFAGVNCITGMILEKREALTHRYEGLAAKIDKYGYDSKQLHHIVRCQEFLERFTKGVPYTDCLIPTNKDELIKIKADNSYYSCEEAVKMADKLVDEAKSIKADYMDTHTAIIDESVDELFSNTLVELMKASLRKELQCKNECQKMC